MRKIYFEVCINSETIYAETLTDCWLLCRLIPFFFFFLILRHARYIRMYRKEVPVPGISIASNRPPWKGAINSSINSACRCYFLIINKNRTEILALAFWQWKWKLEICPLDPYVFFNASIIAVSLFLSSFCWYLPQSPQLVLYFWSSLWWDLPRSPRLILWPTSTKYAQDSWYSSMWDCCSDINLSIPGTRTYYVTW